MAIFFEFENCSCFSNFEMQGLSFKDQVKTVIVNLHLNDTTVPLRDERTIKLVDHAE